MILRRAHTQLNQRQADIVWLVRFLDRRVCAAEEMNRHTAHTRERTGEKNFFEQCKVSTSAIALEGWRATALAGEKLKKNRAWGASGMKL